MPKAFVTGGSGFVGRSLIKMLISRSWEVNALVRSEKSANTVKKLGATPITGDLDNKIAMRDGMKGCQAVFHSAAYVGDWGKYEDFYKDNVLGTENTLAAALEAKVAKFVHVGTEAVLVGGPPIINVDESRPKPAKPLGLYPLTKAMAEDRVIAANSPNLTTVVVRPRFIWGKDDTTILPRLVKSVKDGQFSWIAEGKYLTSTCHVRNVCEGMILAAERGRGGEAYFLTDGKPIEVREFFTKLLQTQGLDPGNKNLPRWFAKIIASGIEAFWKFSHLQMEPPITKTALKLMGEEVTVNDSKARRELGYNSPVTIEAGLAEMKQQ
ncbi:MAG: NAD-dependent epimerase/dehydratase family protein [Acidobacteria bacterium]|nr:NAD-dependent epimerase/dehydratase family protein [Acidobacteriota bacterium]